MRKHQFVVAAMCVLVSATSASADDGLPLAEPTPTVENQKGLDLSWLWDGGAIPFIYAPLAGRILIEAYATPRESPFLFASEGGAEPSDWQIPGWAVTSLGGVSAIGMIASGDRSRFYHVKGLAQSLSTGVLVTGIVKIAVGRHRPDWTEENNSSYSRRSFPSGHSTQAFAIATYTTLYLRGHVFKDMRGDRILPWYEGLTYGGIAAAATALAGERVVHNRHHLTDVIVGGLLGTASSTLFYLYQDGRYDDHEAATRKQLTITPVQTGSGATVGVSFAF